MLQTGNRELPLPRGVAETLIVTASLAAALALATVWGLSNSLDIHTFHLDGAYQTASGLYRLADGQWPGRDFFPYLGIGVMFLQYPVFLLAGGHFAASLFASHFVVAASYCYGTAVIAGLLAPSRRLLTGLVLGSALVAWAIWRPGGFAGEITVQLSPGNSLRAVRSVLPYIVAGIVYALLRSGLRSTTIFTAIGAIAGASIVWSNDFGFPAAAILIVFACWLARRQAVLSLRLAASMVGAAAVAAAVVLSVSTLGHPIEMLRYNLVDVRIDQYWYFAPWTADSRILTFGDLATKLSHDIGLTGEFGWWWWLGPVALCVAAFRRPTIEYALLLFIGVTLAAGGVLAAVGGHREPGYLVAFFFWGKVTTIVGGLLLGLRLASRVPVIKGWKAPLAAVAVLLLLAFQVAVAWRVHVRYAGAQSTARTDPNRFFVSELGGYLDRGWHTHVQLARQSSSPHLEEYWGIWSAIQRKKASAPTDSVIHALGATRQQFMETVQALPPVVVTTPRTYSGDWQPWNVSMNWWFYKPVLENYRPTKTSPSTLVWQRAAPVPWAEVACAVEAGLPPRFSLPDVKRGHYEVEIELRTVDIPARALLMARNNIVFVASAEGYLSLDPRRKRAAFPVAALDDGRNEFDLKVIAAPGERAVVELAGCTARRIPIDDPEVLSMLDFLASDTPWDLTDGNWVKGVARIGAGFFVNNNERNRTRYRVGAKVRLADGQVRTVASHGNSGSFLNVFLDGAALDGMRVGHPHKLEIVE